MPSVPSPGTAVTAALLLSATPLVASAQAAVLSGRVLADSAGAPVRFPLVELPTLGMGVRDTIDVELGMGRTLTRPATVRTSTSVPSIPSWRLEEFEARRAKGCGTGKQSSGDWCGTGLRWTT
jgi:hypothetical protein